MALGQSSFRRMLLSRLLLVSIPVLLLGVFVTYRKIRSELLETSRQNLTESAVRRAQAIDQSIKTLKSYLIAVKYSSISQSDSPQKLQTFVEQLAIKLPTKIQCVQLQNLRNGELSASTCGDRPISSINPNIWSNQPKTSFIEPDLVNVQLLSFSSSQIKQNHLNLFFSAPIYDEQGQLYYAINVKSLLLAQEELNSDLLNGYPVAIDNDGLILTHPSPERVGDNIQQIIDSDRINELFKKAVAGRKYFLYLFSSQKDKKELLTGYTAIPSPLTGESDKKWTILAITPSDVALSSLKEITEVLLIMTLTLIAVILLATLYVARELVLPIEQLKNYAVQKKHLDTTEDQIPDNFHIREFDQLSMALNEMFNRFQIWGYEVVSAWKEAQNANQLKSEFLRITSHELRNPLNVIINGINLVREGYCDSEEEQLYWLDQAQNAAYHLLGIINDILQMSTIEAGKLVLNIESVTLSKIVKEVIDLQRLTIQKKGLELEIWPSKEDIVVLADSAKLKQVLINVVGNAIKFTEAGSIIITTYKEDVEEQISSHSELVENSKEGQEQIAGGKILNEEKITQRATIVVQDTGIGIDSDGQSKLFRPFVMIDGSTTRKYSGTGLGLAISRKLIELMGGSINLYSAGLDQGTTVTISLPVEVNSQPQNDEDV
jgi:two-component system, NarL family, sensor histidine kinase BarA